MQFESFKRIVTTFADENNEVVVDKGHLLLFIRGNLVEAEIQTDLNRIKVEHDDAVWTAEQWIRSYLARLPTLADRIINYVSPPKYYVSPSANLLDWQNKPQKDCTLPDSTNELRNQLSHPPLGITSIYFLTSDAGEGKTSLIEKISVDQALAFKRKETSALILPVPLEGRPFLRLDDAVVASLLNRLRFPFLYYDSFLELVKMGAIVPAFDGFEEMLVDTKSNEAFSAIGQLVNQLSSTGTLLVATRRAYFDVLLRTQTKLLDSVRSDQNQNNVETHQFALNRWDREVFLKYASKRGICNPGDLYSKVIARLGRKDHPVLTRAVLVQRLMDVAEEEEDLDKFLRRIGHSPTDCFFDFVEGIIDREMYKWLDKSLDKSGDQVPLLTRDEHHELLSQFAFEMWVNSVDALNLDVVQLVVEFFAEKKGKNPSMLRQISIRIPDHSLLSQDEFRGVIRVRFDHEDFQEFYLGQALARALEMRDSPNAKLILDARALTPSVIKEATRYLTDQNTSISIKNLLCNLHELSQGTWYVSYIRENCAALMLELMEYSKETHSINDVSFPANALQQRKLQNLDISNSFFNMTSLANSEITNCRFYKCRFAQLALDDSEKLGGTVFDDCIFDSIAIGKDSEDQRVFFDPDKISVVLNGRGVKLGSQQEEIAGEIDVPSMDDDMKIAMQFIRMFNRATAINENVIGQRIGKQSGYFFKKILPKLQSAHLVGSTGRSGNKLRLIVPLWRIDELVDASGSIFNQFIQEASSQELGVAST
ncbi:MAG: hypothetical protein OXD43_11430 [Bacteroidetes bacterium]|nr:hypothetical protein [Bacteroidota bacterium]